MAKLICYYYKSTTDSYTLHLYLKTQQIAYASRRQLNDEEQSKLHPNLTAKQSYKKRIEQYNQNRIHSAGYPIPERAPIQTVTEVIATAEKLRDSKHSHQKHKIVYREVTQTEYWQIQKKLSKKQTLKTFIFQ